MNATSVAVVAAIVLLLAPGAKPRPADNSERADALRRPGPSQPISLPGILRRRPRAGPSDVARWCDALARSVRHGSTIQHALIECVPDDAVLARRTEPVRHRLRRGAGVLSACDEWSTELDAAADPESELMATVPATIAAALLAGGQVAAPLNRLASAMRQRAALRNERAAHSAQARMSARVMTVVPLGVLALLAVTDAGVRAALASRAGAVIVGVGLVLNALGGWWMHRIIDGATR